MSKITFIEFRPWIMQALERADVQKMQIRFAAAFPNHFANTMFNEGVTWQDVAHYLCGPFYELYIQHSQDPDTIKNVKVYRSLWKFVRTSRKMMALPFFRKLYPESVITQKLVEALPIGSVGNPEILTGNSAVAISPTEEYSNIVKMLKEVLEDRYLVLTEDKITPKIFFHATQEELKWILSQKTSRLLPGEKLALLQIHRRLH